MISIANADSPEIRIKTVFQNELLAAGSLDSRAIHCGCCWLAARLADLEPSLQKARNSPSSAYAKKIGSAQPMIILDTDHLSTLKYSDSDKFVQLAGKMADAEDQDFVTTVVTLEEQMRGWLARMKRANEIEKEIVPYEELIAMVDFFSYWKLLPMDQAAANEFTKIRQSKIRIGSMDMKIAAISFANNALLLTANTRHFGQVPELRIEDWIN